MGHEIVCPDLSGAQGAPSTDDRQAFARGEIWQHGAFTKVLLDALAADDIDTDCNGVITMANLTVTMTTTRRLSQEEIEARVESPTSALPVTDPGEIIPLFGEARPTRSDRFETERRRRPPPRRPPTA